MNNKRHPGLFCLCGRIIQDYIDFKKIKRFSIDDWNLIYSEGLIINYLQRYPTTNRITMDFKEGNKYVNPDLLKNAKKQLNIIIFKDIKDEFKLNINDESTIFIANEGLITLTNFNNSTFKITSPIIRDTYGILLFQNPKLKNLMIHQNNFDIIQVLKESFQCFDREKLKNCYKYATKKIEEKKYICGDLGLTESVYQFELGSILRSIMPFDFNLIAHAKTKEESKNAKYPDLLIVCDKFKIVLELLSNERYSHKSKEVELPSSVLGHITRTKSYSDYFEAEPWIIHFIELKSIEDYKKINFPNSKDVNIMYLFHDHKFTSIKMKYQKINQKEYKVIDI